MSLIMWFHAFDGAHNPNLPVEKFFYSQIRPSMIASLDLDTLIDIVPTCDGFPCSAGFLPRGFNLECRIDPFSSTYIQLVRKVSGSIIN